MELLISTKLGLIFPVGAIAYHIIKKLHEFLVRDRQDNFEEEEEEWDEEEKKITPQI